MIEIGRTTKERILDAAEKLFAEQGLGETSLRSVIAEAGVNLAAIHYHFGSKDALVEAVVDRRIAPLNEARLASLDEAERQFAPHSPPVEGIVEAFVAPALRFCRDSGRGDLFMKLMGRLLAEPEFFFERIAKEQFGQVRDRFVAAVERALPGLPREEVMWRLMFGIGALVHTMRSAPWMQSMSDGICVDADVDMVIARLVRYVSAGLRAPAEGGSK
jgi:AcrR family transcriptional regulator